MKRKKIEPGEEFIMGTEVFCYNLIDGKLILKKIGSADVKPSKSFTPPSKEEVKEYFKSKKYLESAAIKFWEYYDSANWKDGKGNQVKNWRQKAIGVWFKKENEDTGNVATQSKVVNNFFQKD